MTYKLRQISPAVFSTQTTQDSLGGTPQAPAKALPTKAAFLATKRQLVLDHEAPAPEGTKAKSPTVCTAKTGGVKREASGSTCVPHQLASHI